MTAISTSPATDKVSQPKGWLARLHSLHDAVFQHLERTLSGWFVPTLARFTFAAVLLVYFWASALTKLGPGVFGLFVPSTGAYAQIFPRKAEAVLYDPGQFSIFEKAIILAGTWAEFLLPLLIVLGLFTRLAALGMIGFVSLQSLTDVHGHMIDSTTIGAWFDRASDSLVMDQRMLWVFLLVVLVLRGAGPVSLDRFFAIR